MIPKSFTDLHKKHQGKVSDKWSFYLDQYERLFNPLRDKAISLFEIGIQNGGSLEIWSKYFPRAKVFVGCDIDKKCSKLTFQDPRINLVVGDANQQKIQKEVIQKGGPFDIVLDDGSHRSDDIIKSFVNYFPHLADSGVYVIEDLHCSYWENFEGGLFAPYSSMTFFKQLTDLLNYEHWGVSKDYTEILKGFSVEYDLKLKQDILEKIESIEFLNSMCVIRKSSGKRSGLGLRIVTGKVATVSEAPKKVNLTKSISPSQINNVFSERKLPPAEEVIILYKKIQTQETKIQTQETKIQTQENLLNQIINSRSWKITRPLRFIRNKIRVVEPFLKYEKYIKAFNLVRRHGFLDAFIIIKSKIISPNSNSNNYADWILKNEVPESRRLKGLLKNNFRFKENPLISIVMPVFNPNKKWLIEAIQSVQNQSYENWEICIADDKSTDATVKTFLNNLSKNDKRIKVFFRKKNGHISEASNTAISISKGKWIGLLDQDDLLSEHALFWVVAAINQKPNIKMIYSDEDKFYKSVQDRFFPYFKPEWNLPLFYSYNFFSHFGVFRKDLVLDVGGFRKGFEGSQDYDLTLRCSEKVSSQDIFHIPKVLYHWRSHNKSTSFNSNAKSYAIAAGNKALCEHFKRLKIPVKINSVPIGYQVLFNLPKKPPLVSVIICTRNKADYLKRCISSLLDKTSYKNYEIIVIDNGSDEKETLDYLSSLKKYERIKIYKDNRPFNYSQLNNFGVKKAKGSIVALLNNDVEIINDSWLGEMVSLASLKYAGAVGAKLYYPDDTIQHAGVVLGIGGLANHAFLRAHKSDPGYMGRAFLRSSYSAVTGACLVVKKSIFNLVGGLDEKNLKVAFNDVDLCLKIRAKGYMNIWTPYAELYHHESISRGKDTPANTASWKRAMGEVQFMQDKWKDDLLNDPCYSPNLSLENTNFSYAFYSRKSDLDLIEPNELKS